MNKDEFHEVLKNATGYPVAYIKFREPQKLPFVAYAVPSSDDFHADNGIALKIGKGWIELYSEQPDFEGQERIEQCLSDNKIPYGKEDELYIDDEDMFLCRWKFQLI